MLITLEHNMAVELVPIKHGWETRLDKYAILVKDGLATNNFGIIDNFIAAEQLSGIDHEATFHDFIDRAHLDQGFDQSLHGVPDQLKDINSKAVETGQNAYQDLNDSVTKLKDQKPDKPSWEQKIDDAGVKAKEISNKAIDDATTAAKEVIGKLPEGSREVASNVFVSGFNAVQQFFKNVWTQIKAVAQAVYQFLLGVWTALEKAWNAVKSAAETAWTWIKGNLGLLKAPEATLSGHDDGGQTALHGSHASEKGHGHSATLGGGNDWAKKGTGH